MIFWYAIIVKENIMIIALTISVYKHIKPSINLPKLVRIRKYQLSQYYMVIASHNYYY